jgi:hypothetical protein
MLVSYTRQADFYSALVFDSTLSVNGGGGEVVGKFIPVDARLVFNLHINEEL